MAFQWFSTLFFDVLCMSTLGKPWVLQGCGEGWFSMFFQGQAEEKRAEAEMEELEKHRVTWPEICRELGVS